MGSADLVRAVVHHLRPQVRVDAPVEVVYAVARDLLAGATSGSVRS